MASTKRKRDDDEDHTPEKKIKTDDKKQLYLKGLDAALNEQTDAKHLPRADQIQIWLARLSGQNPIFLNPEQYQWKEEVIAEWRKEIQLDPIPMVSAPGAFGYSESNICPPFNLIVDWDVLAQHPSAKSNGDWCEATDRFYTCKPIYAAHLRQKFWKEKPYLVVVSMVYAPDRCFEKNTLCIPDTGAVAHGVFTAKICSDCDRVSLFYKDICMCRMHPDIFEAT